MSSPNSRLRGLLTAAAAVALLLATASAAYAAQPLETVRLQKIKLPAKVDNAAQPVYAKDGRHLLFAGNVVADGNLNPDPDRGRLHVWIVGTDGRHAHCISCGTDEPLVGEAEQPGLIQPFPDGKRVFYGPYGDPRVLECAPSVLRCKHARTLPIDLTGARPASPLIPPGGAVTSPALYAPGAASPKLSPDGKYIAFSDVRTDAIEAMVLARLTRAGNEYVATDPHILNPPGPSSPSVTNPVPWSRSAGLFEFKTFVDGGRAVTYVQVGGVASGNPDLWKLDLKTGKRTRLTSYPEWEEDMSYSPDGRNMLVTIDSQGRHYLDWAALMPFRGFFDAPWIVGVAVSHVSSAKLRSCAPFATQMLPARGDRHGKLVGQVLNPYRGGAIRDSGDINGWPTWKPDSTAVALSTQSFKTLAGAPYLLVAHFNRRPTKPMRVVSSAPGTWAPTNAEYHGAIGATSDVTLKGLASGTARVHYANSFGARGPVTMTAVYDDYSDDGKSFVNGTQTVMTGDSTRIVNDLTLSGAHTGSAHGDVTFYNDKTYTGSQTTTYDGTTVTGPKSHARLCRRIRKVLPRRTKLRVHAKRSGRKVRVKVTSVQRRAGPDEQSVDRRPVRGATVRIGRRRATTNARGIARLRGTRTHRVRVSAGDTFKRGTTRVR